MPRIFKGSESSLTLLIGKSGDYQSMTNLRIKLYTTDINEAIEIIDGILIDGNTATVNLAPRALIGMEDGLINYIIEGVVGGDLFHTERQSNYMLRSLSYINENGVAIQKIEVNENGKVRITPNDGLYVDVDVNVPNEAKSINITENGTYRPDGDYVGYDEVNVNVPNRTTKLEATENGTYRPDGDYVGYDEVNVDVSIPAIQEEATLRLYTGDKGILTPDEGFDAIARVNYEVIKETGPKKKILNSLKLAKSTFEEFDGSNWDWSQVRDAYSLFAECKELQRVTGLNLKPVSCYRMFDNCTNLTSIDLSMCDFSDAIVLIYMFRLCTKLTELRMGGPISTTVYTRDMFGSVSTTGTFYYPKEYDYTPIINALPSKWTAVAY